MVQTYFMYKWQQRQGEVSEKDQGRTIPEEFIVGTSAG
jgi:hypothetical protein